MSSPWIAALSLLCGVAALAATRPHYGGTLRIEVRKSIETPDPPETGPGMADLAGPFSIWRWEAGRRAVYAASENAPAGRPFLDAVEIEMGRPLRDEAIDLELGRADIIEMSPGEPRRQPPGRSIWTSLPVRLLALVFAPRVEDARVRQALDLAVDRAAIHNVLLQRLGEVSGGLLPQWLSGYAFLFPSASDATRAREIAASLPLPARALTLALDNPADRPIADRIALNARDAGLAVTLVSGAADVRLAEARIASSDPVRVLAGIAAILGLPEPPPADSPEALYAAERSLLDGFRAIPLFYLPDIYGVGPRVKGGPGITPLGEWRFDNVWLESGRP